MFSGRFTRSGVLCNLCGLRTHVDVGTIGNYLEILEEGYIIKTVSPFTGGKHREITGANDSFVAWLEGFEVF